MSAKPGETADTTPPERIKELAGVRIAWDG